jgi:predicted transglutaminase-like cysteine proteinase
MKPFKLALFLCVSLLGMGNLGTPTPALAWTQMPTGAPAIPPAGFLGFCAKHLPECLSRGQEPTTIELTDERRQAIEAVQTTINASITPRLDPAHVWDYSTDGTGDCNKFALTKRRELIAQGFPKGAVLLATATTERGEGHLVVVVRTDRGDFVLDNRVAHVVDWSSLPYHWVSVQSQQSPVRWLSILSQPIATADASKVIGSPVVQAR